MNTAEIIRQLENAGIHVLPQSDATQIFIEDPACILRGFQTFAEYAWAIIAVLTCILLFGWAIALIRGSNNNLITNVRNLLIMFGTLAAVGPIVNSVWGGDLFGRGCRRIAVPIESVAEILRARDRHLRDSDRLYEVFEISDTGAIAADGIVTSPADEYISAPATADSVVAPAQNAGGNAAPAAPGPVSGPSSGRRAVSAVADRADVIYIHNDASRTRYTSGTRAWRNTNPGNIRFSEFSRGAGAIGTAGGFAVFPTEDTGQAAIISLLQSGSYRNLTIADAISRYAPPFENDTAAYYRTVAEMTGLDIGRRISELGPDEMGRVANAIRRIEGWRVGQKIELKD